MGKGVNMKKNILIIEDELLDRLSIQRFFKNLEDQYTYTVAGSVKEALELSKTINPDVIVSDYHLGDGEAIEIIENCKDIPIIIVTGGSDVELAVKCMKAGAYDFLLKDQERSYLKMIPVACESAIKRREQEVLLGKLALAVDQSPSLIMITNKDSVIEYINPKLIEITGYNQDELIGQKPSIFSSDFHDQKFYGNIKETLKNGNKWTGEFYNRTKSNNFYWEFSSIAPMFNKKGEITHFVKVGEDITDKKKAESMILYNEKLKSILEMAGAVSHEMNQPLQIILGHSELLYEKGEKDPPLQKSINTIIDNVKRIVNITNKIRNITEYKTKRYTEDTEIVDLNQNKTEFDEVSDDDY